MNFKGLFLGALNANKDCDLFVGQQGLDREVEEFYKIIIKLNSLSAFVNPERSIAEVTFRSLSYKANQQLN